MLQAKYIFACVAVAALSTASITQADTLAWSGDRVAFTNDSFVIPSTVTDWWLGSGNRMSGGSAISASNMPSTYSEVGYPQFSYSNGVSPTSAVDEQGTYAYGYAHVSDWIPTHSATLNVLVPQGSGQVAFWCGGGGANAGDDGVYVSVALGSQTLNAGTYEVSNAGRWKYVLDYTNTSSTAQTMTISLQPFYSEEANIGFFAATLQAGSVPEPSAVILVATGLFGLLAYAWRNRK
jgi:hypothetical protein